MILARRRREKNELFERLNAISKGGNASEKGWKSNFFAPAAGQKTAPHQLMTLLDSDQILATPSVPPLYSGQMGRKGGGQMGVYLLIAKFEI